MAKLPPVPDTDNNTVAHVQPAPSAPPAFVQAAPPANTVEQQIDGTAPVNQAAQTTTEKKLSPKHKESRGVPAGFKTTWVPLDLPEAESDRIHQVASVRNQKVPDLLQEVLKYGLEQYKAQFHEDVKKYVPSTSGGKTAKKLADMSPEEAEKYAMTSVERQTKALQNAQAMLEAAKQKARDAAEANKAIALAAASNAQGTPITSI